MTRKLLILSTLALVAAGAGCSIGHSPCDGSTGWYPGQYLFGRSQRQTYQQCCESNMGMQPAMMQGPVMAPSYPMMAPTMQAAPCCQ